MKKMSLSVVIIAQNEEQMLLGCLNSIKGAGEVIVVDSGSTDGTLVIAKKYGCRFYFHKWKGFASQKNFGINKAKGKWILVLDADERISPGLWDEINETIARDPIEVAFDIPFRNFFLGKEMQHGGWQHEWHIRLFKKGCAKYRDQEIHEYLELSGSVGKLKNVIFHFSHRDIASNLLKTRQYAIIQSKIEMERGYPLVTRRTLFHNILEHFWLRYIRLEGYKDGMEGFLEAVYQAFSQIFVIQSMIWERQRQKTVGEIYKNLEKKLMG